MSQATAIAADASQDTPRSVLSSARFNRREIAGSLGDMGTFLPLLVGMTVQNGLSFSTALLFAGLFNIITGLAFAVPMAVQPMKAIAAIAITQKLSVSEIVLAGAVVSLFVLLLGLTGLVNWFTRVIPPPVVRGIQVAVGLSLAIKGIGLISGTGSWLAADGYLTATAAAIVAVLLANSRTFPAALVLFAGGLGLVAFTSPAVFSAVGIGVTLPQLIVPDFSKIMSASSVALPQLPLTTLNSVVAVCALSASLFPGREVSPRKVAVSVGAMNLIGVWFGAMPMCHGAGGMAGQYAFGARTNGSILFLGTAKVLLAVLLGSSLLAVAMAFPMSILGVMLAASGVELARSASAERTRHGWTVLLSTVAACLAFDNLMIGLLVGLACHLLLRAGAKSPSSEATD